MGVKVTVKPHQVKDASNGKTVTFDQFMIMIGQRVVGYLGKAPHLAPTLVVRDLPEDCLSAINDACDQVHKRGKYVVADGGEANAPSVPATVTVGIGSDPTKEPAAPLPATDAAADAELEASLGNEQK